MNRRLAPREYAITAAYNMLHMLRNAFITALTLMLLAGCSFDRQWRQLSHAAAAGESETSDKLAGRWEGKWVSEANNHRGKLRAIVTPLNDTTYRANFDATYLGLLRFGYGMGLKAAPRANGVIIFEGQEDLGPLAGGVYRYKGTADGTTFHCLYESGNDHGYFEMIRPQARP